MFAVISNTTKKGRGFGQGSLYQENQDRVALRPEYTETLVGGATADAFGSAIGKGLQSVASGMDVAAEAVQRAADAG